MRPRHAAALALVGWYLIVPLIHGKGTVVDSKASPDTHYIIFDARINVKAPLSKWMVLHTAESEHDCYAFLAQSKKTVANPGRTEKERRLNEKMGKILIDHATCIATDDPRLKGK